MVDLWQLGGIDQGAQYRGLEWDWVARSYKKLAMRLHPDKLNNVLNDPSCTLTPRTKKVLSGLWSLVEQKHGECQGVLRGGPAGVAPITDAAAVIVILPTGRCIYVTCDAVVTDISPDDVTDTHARTTVLLYFPGERGNEDTKCIPMNVAYGTAHLTLSEGDYPWLFYPETRVRLQRTNQSAGVQETHVEVSCKLATQKTCVAPTPTTPKPSRAPRTTAPKEPDGARNRDTHLRRETNPGRVGKVDKKPDIRPSAKPPRPSRAPQAGTYNEAGGSTAAPPESDAAQTRAMAPRENGGPPLSKQERRQRLDTMQSRVQEMKAVIDSITAEDNKKKRRVEQRADRLNHQHEHRREPTTRTRPPLFASIFRPSGT